MREHGYIREKKGVLCTLLKTWDGAETIIFQIYYIVSSFRNAEWGCHDPWVPITSHYHTPAY